MSDALLDAFEVHSPAAIRAALAAGVDANAEIRGRAPVDWLIDFYTRSPRFAECLRVLFDGGARLDDPLLRAVLLDDADALRAHLAAHEGDLERRFTRPCAYTSLAGVTALHVAAEYNSLRCAEALLELGLDVDAPAEVDADGLGGHTALFHTVNSNRDHGRPTMELLARAGASLELRVKALGWGLGHDWETIVYDVTPISYAQCGLYPQLHRTEEQVYANVAWLWERREGSAPPVRNVPNRYVDPAFDLAAARRGAGADRVTAGATRACHTLSPPAPPGARLAPRSRAARPLPPTASGNRGST